MNLRSFFHLAVSVTLVLLVGRTFFVLGLFVPIIVSGDSMAPGYRGLHCESACTACGRPVVCGLQHPPEDDLIVCGNCNRPAGKFSAAPSRLANRLWIDRTTFLFRDLRRWEVMVFRCPERRTDYCLKRVVGLPGEKIQLVDGDVWINGQLAYKNLSQQRACRQSVYDARFPTATTRWQAEQTGSTWHQQSGRFTVAAPAKGPIDWLVFRLPDGPPLTDANPYNQGLTRPLHRVSDLMVTTWLQVTKPGTLWLRFRSRGQTYRASLDVMRRQVRLKVNEHEVLRRDLSAVQLTSRPGIPIEFSCFDQSILLALDGNVIFHWKVPHPNANRPGSSATIAIGGQTLTATLDELQLWRDIYYSPGLPGTASRAVARVAQLADDEFFVLGDNSPASRDSRHWAAGAVARSTVLGRPYRDWHRSR